MKTPKEYENLFITALINDYPNLLNFELDVKEYDEKTDEHYTMGTSTNVWQWFIERNTDIILAIKSTHPRAKEACLSVLYPDTSKPLTIHSYCEMEYISLELTQEPPPTLLGLIGITKEQFNEMYSESPDGKFRQVISQSTIENR